jgi:hypothetical protein
MNDGQTPNSQDGPINPSSYASWIHVVHSDADNGARHPDWWWHNQKFKIDQNERNVTIHFVIANRGWADAAFVMVDYFVPSLIGIIHERDESISLMSGQLQTVDFKFNLADKLPIDSTPASANSPSIVIRVTDLTTPAPSTKEILSCLKELDIAKDDAIEKIRKWKNVPGLFVYPCCALFPGRPNQ